MLAEKFLVLFIKIPLILKLRTCRCYVTKFVALQEFGVSQKFKNKPYKF